MHPLIWLEPWRGLAEANRRPFETELQRELSPAHPLFDIGAEAIGKSEANDDVLFQLQNGEFALVHLTWTGHIEATGQWPYYELYQSWNDFVTQRMQHDNFGYDD